MLLLVQLYLKETKPRKSITIYGWVNMLSLDYGFF